MKKVLLWITIGVAGTLVLLAGIGYVGRAVDPKEPPVTKKSVSETVSNSQPVDRLTKLNQTLASHDLTLCEVYNWIGTMEAETRRDFEKAVKEEAPDMSAAEQDSRLSDLRGRKWLEYRTKYGLSDSVRSAINVYGLQQCN